MQALAPTSNDARLNLLQNVEGTESDSNDEHAVDQMQEDSCVLAGRHRQHHLLLLVLHMPLSHIEPFGIMLLVGLCALWTWWPAQTGHVRKAPGGSTVFIPGT